MLPTDAAGTGRNAEPEALLALCTGTTKVYFWSSLTGVHMEDVSADSTEATGRIVAITGLRWSSDGEKLLLSGRGEERSFCCCCVIAGVGAHDQRKFKVERTGANVMVGNIPGISSENIAPLQNQNFESDVTA